MSARSSRSLNVVNSHCSAATSGRADRESLRGGSVSVQHVAVAAVVVHVLPSTNERADEQDEQAITDNAQPVRSTKHENADNDAGRHNADETAVFGGRREAGQQTQ